MDQMATDRQDVSRGSESDTVDTRRRGALLKLGIAGAVAYTAPTVLKIDRNVANAMGSTCNNGGGNGSEDGCSPGPPGNDDESGNGANGG